MCALTTSISPPSQGRDEAVDLESLGGHLFQAGNR
jgi:hypothetical protein